MPELNMAIIWIVIAVILSIIEAITVSLVSIWFAVGAVAAVIPAYFGAPIWVQILVFLAVSAVSFAFTRRFFKDVVKVKKQPTNADSLIGKDGIVTAEINNLSGGGKLFISGLTWSAKSANGEDIPEGAVATVKKIEGVTLVVKAKDLSKNED
ncbi:MAG: NfeD family protein [Oscillospiraceae bacterium]|nr:NfeD family protein [Oscillospiraceae bacterium]